MKHIALNTPLEIQSISILNITTLLVFRPHHNLERSPLDVFNVDVSSNFGYIYSICAEFNLSVGVTEADEEEDEEEDKEEAEETPDLLDCEEQYTKESYEEVDYSKDNECQAVIEIDEYPLISEHPVPIAPTSDSKKRKRGPQNRKLVFGVTGIRPNIP